VNRKVFSVVLWCLILPAIVTMILYALRKYQFVPVMRYTDTIIFLPAFFYALYSLWPTIRDLPQVFKKGGLGALLDESVREVEWRERIAAKMETDLRFTPKEWSTIEFHLQKDIQRMGDQNRYMTILTAVVLFLMFQFLDLGGSPDIVMEAGPAGLMKAWVDQFSQWSVQVFSLILFSALFYLSGLQFQRYLGRYAVCVECVLRKSTEN
jgi:hypothetical protein